MRGSNTVSVIMATYNGERYIREQIESIVSQMGDDDELIISDDGSVDNTMQICRTYAENDKRISCINGPHKGYVYNFEFLMSQAKNEIIMISDQDDVWRENKIAIVREHFQEHPNAWVVLHDADYIDDSGNTIGETIFRDRKAKHGFIKNLIKSSYYGCCMSLSKDYKNIILPFPMHALSYDQWIGLFAEKSNRSVFCEKTLIHHRVHDSNQTKKRNIVYRLMFRTILLFYMLLLEIRYNRYKGRNEE